MEWLQKELFEVYKSNFGEDAKPVNAKQIRLFISENMQWIKPGNIKEAFKFMYLGKVDFVNHYGKFNIAFVTRVLNNYRNYNAKQVTSTQAHEVNKTPEQLKNIGIECVKSLFKKRQEQKPGMFHVAYNPLVDYYGMSKDSYLLIDIEAGEEVSRQWLAVAKVTAQRLGDKQGVVKADAALKNGFTDPTVENARKHLAVLQYFDLAIKEGREL